MLKLASGYVRVVDKFNYYVGRVMMYGIFALMGAVDVVSDCQTGLFDPAILDA